MAQGRQKTTESTSSPRSAAGRVRTLLDTFSSSERRVAERVLEDPESVAASTISELARACATSETTVVRFCRTAGFAGYPELRLTLAAETAQLKVSGQPPVGGRINPDDDLESVLRKIAYTDSRAVEDTLNELDRKQFVGVVDAVASAKRIDAFGVVASALVAADLQQKLHRIGRVAFAWSDTHQALTSAALLEPGDVMFGFSHSGATEETVTVLKEAKRRGGTTVAVTGSAKSPITEVADFALITSVREATHRAGAMASRIGMLAIVDCVFAGVGQRRFDETHAHLEDTFKVVRQRRLKAPARRV
jgi:DNA-binding MurR/RpiR family transcriptional regulator